MLQNDTQAVYDSHGVMDVRYGNANLKTGTEQGVLELTGGNVFVNNDSRTYHEIVYSIYRCLISQSGQFSLFETSHLHGS